MKSNNVQTENSIKNFLRENHTKVRQFLLIFFVAAVILSGKYIGDYIVPVFVLLYLIINIKLSIYLYGRISES